MSTNFSDSSASRLTGRQQKIIRILADSGKNPIPVGAVAQKLGISSRTVLRELPDIERWMEENDFSFIRKPGVGLAIDEDEDSLKLLKELLGMEGARASYGQKERRRQLLGELLFAGEPVKSYVFLSRFHISEGTLTRDLDALEEWLSTYQIRLVRRPGVGVSLEGSETAYRQAIANAALEFMDEGEILKLLRGSARAADESDSLSDRLFGFSDPQIVAFVEQILSDTEKELNIKYTDSGYMALVVHLSLAIRRLRSGEKIEMEKTELTRLSGLPEYPAAEQIARQVGSRFRLNLPPEEVGFIAMHLSSARIWPQTRRMRGQLQTLGARQVVMRIVESVEQQLHLPFHTCTRMIEELTSHMDSMLSRLSMNLHLDNAHADAIRQNYPEVYEAVEYACSLLSDLPWADRISASEVTFVAMHFAAAMETLQVEQRRVSVAVVCPSGMGASRMLAANLMRSQQNIEIRQIMSAFSLEPGKLRESGIDLVISTVPLDIDFPSVCVSPIPQAQDLLLISRTVESIGAGRIQDTGPRTVSLRPSAGFSFGELRSLTLTGLEILELTEHFLIQETRADRPEELLGLAAGLFSDGIRSRQVIGQDLARREAVSHTYIPELYIYLLHCRTTAVSHCRFGYLRLARPFTAPEGTVEGAVLLLAPKDGCRECVEVISRISMLLVENEEFLQSLKRGDEAEGRRLVEQCLLKYYQNQILHSKGDETL